MITSIFSFKVSNSFSVAYEDGGGSFLFHFFFLKAKSRIRDHGGEIAQIRGIFRLILSEENFMSMSEKEKREG